MAVLTDLSLRTGLKQLDITPRFNSSKSYYNSTTNSSLLYVKMTTDGPVPLIKINGESVKNIPKPLGDNVYEYQSALGEIKKGNNIIDIGVKESEDPLDTNGSYYRITLNNITDSNPEKSGIWPIQEHTLRPGFYGGSYVPTFRQLKEIYTCGSDDKDFEGNYNTKYILNEEAISFMDKLIANFTKKGKLEAIVESFIHYSGFVNSNWVDDGDYRYYLPLIEVGVDRPDHMRNNFKPKNNKLFSYPYTALKIMGYGGESELKYEHFPENIRFGIVSKFFAGQSIQLYPVNYEGILDAYNAGVTGQPLPVFPYTKDQYLNEWNAISNSRIQNINAMEQNKNLQILQSVIGGVTGATSGAFSSITSGKTSNVSPTLTRLSTGASVLGSVVSTAANIGGAVLTYNQGLAAMAAQLKDTEARPSSVANQNASPAIPAVMKDAVVPYVQRVSIREVFAKKIDEFFTCYGYRTNRNGIPNIKSRPAFNFLRCTQAKIEGNIPNEDLLEIKRILEHGITFWHNHDVGNYNLSNPAPITNNPRYCLPVG